MTYYRNGQAYLTSKLSPRLHLAPRSALPTFWIRCCQTPLIPRRPLLKSWGALRITTISVCRNTTARVFFVVFLMKTVLFWRFSQLFHDVVLVKSGFFVRFTLEMRKISLHKCLIAMLPLCRVNKESIAFSSTLCQGRVASVHTTSKWGWRYDGLRHP